MPAPENQKSLGRKSAVAGTGLLLTLSLLLVFAPPVAASDYYTMNAYALYFDVHSPNNVTETVEMNLIANSTMDSYIIYTDYPVENPWARITLGNTSKPINVTVSSVLGGTNAIYMRFPKLKPGERAVLRLTFTTRGMIAENGGREQFTYYVKFSQPVGLFHVQLTIPRGYAVLSPIIPSPDKVESSTNRLLLEWNRRYVNAGDEFYFIVGFSGKLAVPARPSPLLYTGIFLAGLLVGGGSVYGYVLYREKKREEEKTHLRSDEERIMAMLDEGPILQSELAEKLGVSKAKVSIILREMEEKGLITRVREGRTYRVFLRE
ncbi:MarR family transcriptional regulator [Thermococcus sp.]|uniref:helix-turn-helix transcriptional regulator n=1 Tax=Thermococcus sp. TaxID=35749 RepID=UPI00261CD072|nr:MarR family transcriptional regulator [Thermococcus sp.]